MTVADLATARNALAATLGTVTGLNVSAKYVLQVNPPQAVIFPQPGQDVRYVALGGVVNYLLTCVLLVSPVALDEGQAAMDALISDSIGASPNVSALAALRASPSLGGVVAYAVPVSVNSYRLGEWAGETFLRTDLLIEVAV